MNIYDEFEWRGLVHTDTPDAKEALGAGSLAAYIGFDPSNDSLHVGTLIPIMALARLQRAGHRAIVLVGGGTGMIGDPSGKTKERQLLSEEHVGKNVAAIKAQIAKFLDDGEGKHPVTYVDNADWLRNLNLIEFLREVGKHFSVKWMIDTRFVKARLDEESRLSFTEFAYMLLQAYDFLQLHDREGCTLQMGGADQWVNVLAGADLIRKMRSEKAHGIVMPLLETASGVKFGKTEEGAVWLDAKRTSPYKFFQFWINTDDADVVRFLGYFTWLTQGEIEEIRVEHEKAPGRRHAQRRLAEEVTRLTHGDEALERAQRVTSLLFGGSVEALTADEILEGCADAPRSDVAAEDLASGCEVSALFADAGLTQSKGETRRMIQGGGIYVNNTRIENPQHEVTLDHAIDGKVLLLRKGKKTYHVVHVN